MAQTDNWLDAYLQGKQLEQSRDGFNWFDLIQEPSVGDGWFYREKALCQKEKL